MPASSTRLSLILLSLCALLAACDDNTTGSVSTDDKEDANLVDPDRGDNRPPGEMGADAGPAPDMAPDMPPEHLLDMAPGGPDDGRYDGGPPDTLPDRADVAPVEPQCVPGVDRLCPDDPCVDAYQTCDETGEWGPCRPPAEICDGADNDCDGDTDEGFGRGERCAAGSGPCQRAGEVVCTAEGGARCDAEAAPPEEERCNGIDDDCDGTLDEDFGGGGPCMAGLGECAAPGVEICVGQGLACNAEAGEPAPEACNDLDDDCDGTIDEDFDIGERCETGLGACRAEGAWICDGAGDGLCAADGAAPTPEICDGVDDDCDGEVDEGTVDPENVGECVEGVGACQRWGQVVCDEDGDLTCSATPGASTDEVCNGLDDDCDGTVDEGFRLGAACTVGSGVCAASGVRICGDDGRWRCSAVEGEPGEERCNGLDDDCDGEPDEGYDLDVRCEIGVGDCLSGGRTVCAADGGGIECDAPVIAPQDEACNGEDDDCDGEVDEGFGVGEVCVGGEGACAREGRIGCVADAAECEAEPGDPAFERCDGVDEDCDGAVDEGLGLGTVCTVGVGACARPGERVCGDDGETRCAGEPGAPAPERCNAIDDDCDGAIDEGVAWRGIALGDACDEGVGACGARGRVVCADGDAVCDAEPGAPRDEICDGTDDDCDGETDEGFGLGGPCAVGVGECLRRGNRICGDDGGVTCSAEPGPATPEICNGRDDDCDGINDEDQTLDGVPLGARCEKGTGRCLAGGEVICGDGAPTCSAVPGDPRPEVCNGQDDDCDGINDEGLRLGRPCTEGIGACAQDGIRICGEADDVICTASAGAPRDELCDGADDDCDGETDEDYTIGARCSVGTGACAVAGIEVCDADGQGTRCGAVPGAPGDEACNAIDDDCDGRTDEVFPVDEECANGLGTCRRESTFVCADDGDGVRCPAVPGAPAAAEACDDRDDDCDGAVDEDYRLGEACVAGLGICARDGLRICAADGRGACDAEPGDPEEETCNDLDDDCDGVVDEDGDAAPGVAFGACGPRYRSCLDALRAGGVESGVYRVSSENSAGREVYCDQTTDGGGWTLVMATTSGPTDGLGAWHADLLAPFPAEAHDGVWAGLSHLGERPFDLRFACRRAAVDRPDDGERDPGYDVDVAFYGTPWYRQFIRGGEAVSCFAAADGEGQALPARRDLMSGRVRAHGQPYPEAAQGRLVGEPSCDAPNAFFVDFDDGALAGSSFDGTDWGALGQAGVCGQQTRDGQWLVFAREDIPHPLGPMGLINLPQLAEPIEAAGFEPVALDIDDPRLVELLDPAILPAVFIGRYADAWDALPEGLDTAMGCYTDAGGHVVTEFDGFSLVSTRIARDFEYAAGAPPPWGWISAVTGGGVSRGADTAITVTDRLDPITRGLGERFSAGAGSERFLSITRVHPTVPVPLETLASFPGDGDAFPDERYPALMRGRQCGANLLVAPFDYADAPQHPAIDRLVGNLAAAAVSPADPDLADQCGGGLGQPRCEADGP